MGSSCCGDCCQDTPDRRRACLIQAARDEEIREGSSHVKARVQTELEAECNLPGALGR
jgi:hypothetical protein